MFAGVKLVEGGEAETHTEKVVCALGIIILTS